jgi:hypothetical protein
LTPTLPWPKTQFGIPVTARSGINNPNEDEEAHYGVELVWRLAIAYSFRGRLS